MPLALFMYKAWEVLTVRKRENKRKVTETLISTKEKLHAFEGNKHLNKYKKNKHLKKFS